MLQGCLASDVAGVSGSALVTRAVHRGSSSATRAIVPIFSLTTASQRPALGQPQRRAHPSSLSSPDVASASLTAPPPATRALNVDARACRSIG